MPNKFEIEKRFIETLLKEAASGKMEGFATDRLKMESTENPIVLIKTLYLMKIEKEGRGHLNQDNVKLLEDGLLDLARTDKHIYESIKSISDLSDKFKPYATLPDQVDRDNLTETLMPKGSEENNDNYLNRVLVTITAGEYATGFIQKLDNLKKKRDEEPVIFQGPRKKDSNMRDAPGGPEENKSKKLR